MIKRDLLSNVMTTVGFSVAALFVIFGLYVMFTPHLVNIPKEFRNIFGVVVIGYGVFRSVLIYQRSRQRKESDDENE